MDHFCYLCFVFVMLSNLFIAALWSPAGKGLTSLVCNVFLYLCHFPMWCQVWYLIVSITDPCLLTYLSELRIWAQLSVESHRIMELHIYVLV